MDKRQAFTVWYVIGVIVLMVAAQAFVSRAHVKTRLYSDFKRLLAGGRVQDLTLGSEQIGGSVNLTGAEAPLSTERIEPLKQPGGSPHRFVTVRVAHPDLAKPLDAAGVRYTVVASNRWLTMLLFEVLPAVIFVGVWNLMLRRSGAHMGSMIEIGQHKAKVYVQSQTGVKLAKETGAYPEAGQALIAALRPHADWLSRISIIPRGIGAPGFTQPLPTGDRPMPKPSKLLDRLDVLLGGCRLPRGQLTSIFDPDAECVAVMPGLSGVA